MLETSKLNEGKIKRYLSEGRRFDGRDLNEFREIKIETGVSKHAEGSVRVKLGKTEVLVGVKMDVATPFPDTPNQGNLMTNAELTPLSSADFESGPPKTPAIELGRIIDRGIRESKFIDFEKLCIKEGEKVWSVFIDIYSINDDGNLLDAAGIAALIALKNTMVPKYDEEKEKAIYGEHDRKLPLAENMIPISLTVHKIGDNLLIDPLKEEEDVSEMRLTTSGFKDTIFAMQKGESGTIESERMPELLELAEKAREKVILRIKEYL
ncbi:MAG: exosome complex protein Rrp42 [Nanoarchaeota archaeon]|nr:exosome complex protein Rrp42 [Nanoarchaeota archaeon]